jgi:hypothetical protein
MNPSREANEKKCPTEEYILYWRNTTQTPIPIKGSLTFQLLGHKLGYVYLHKRDILNLSSTKEDGYLFY